MQLPSDNDDRIARSSRPIHRADDVMMVTVRLFAILRERSGSDRMELQLADDATVADALQALSKIPSLAGLLERIPVQMAVNRDYASPGTALASNDELALIPPLSGGAPQAGDGVHVVVTDEPLSLENLSRAVADARAGAIVSFQGVTREVDHLDYEAYAEMAQERITLILRESVARHGLCAAAAEHRIGSVALGESSVIVAASAAHRTEAFAGAREIIDRIKAEAPIWKSEVDSEGRSRRVEGTPAPGAGVQPAATSAAEPDGRGG